MDDPGPPDTPGWAKAVRTVISAGQTLLGFLIIAAIVYVVVAVAIDVISGSGGSKPNPPTLTRADAETAVKRYYGDLDHFEYKRAWHFLGPAQQETDVGRGIWSRSFKRNYEMNLTLVTISPKTRTTATALVAYKRLDYDACNNKVWQTYNGTWTVTLRQNEPVLGSEQVDKTEGREPVTAYADCQTILPPPPTQPIASSASSGGGNCDPSYPDQCLQDGIGDYDCANGTGTAPNTADGPLEVTGSDPFGLDRDGNGIGCEQG